MNSFDLITLEATLRALAEQPDPIPDEVRHSLDAIGKTFSTHQSDSPDQLRTWISQSPLKPAYDAAYQSIQAAEQKKERNKSLAAAIANGTLSFDPETLAASIFTAPDPVQAAQQFLRSLNPTTTPVWDRLDRIAVMAAGGAFLGGAIWQIPGAIVGSLIAALYGWYIGFAKLRSLRTR